jgi:hypothetical protein
MTESENDQQRAPSEPDQDPKDNTAPPSNPDVDQEDVEKGEEQIEKISGN